MQDQKKVAKLAKKKEHQRTEEDWNAIWDARQLATAEQIKNDPDRYAKAQLWAAVLVSEENEQAEAMQTVADA